MSRFTLPQRLVVIWWALADVPLNQDAVSLVTDGATGVELIGTSQGEAMAEMNGWVSSPSVIETPDFVSHQVSNVPGDTTIPESSIGIYMDTTTRTMYDALESGVEGAIGVFFDGFLLAEESALYVCTIQNRRRRFARDQGHIVDIDFALSVPIPGAVAA